MRRWSLLVLALVVACGPMLLDNRGSPELPPPRNETPTVLADAPDAAQDETGAAR
jgi:hypothetical protein